MRAKVGARVRVGASRPATARVLEHRGIHLRNDAFLVTATPFGGAAATNSVVLPAGASVMAPPKVQVDRPGGSTSTPGRPRWQFGVPIESMAAGTFPTPATQLRFNRFLSQLWSRAF